MRSETGIQDPIQYARAATRWGLPEPPASAHPSGREAEGGSVPQPPNDWSSMQWMLESRRACLAWVRKASDQDLDELVELGGHASLEAMAGFPIEPETLEATIRTARQALGTRELRIAAGLVAQRARRQPGVWQDLGEPLDQRDAYWVRDMLRRGRDLSVKAEPTAPGALGYRVMAMAFVERDGG